MMASFDNSYSRLVSWAKIVLPMMALALLSTLFMFSGHDNTSQSIPYSQVEIEDLANDPRISAPNYSGVAGDGTAVSLQAETARPDATDSDVILGQNLIAQLETQEGLKLAIVSDQGVFRNDGRYTTLTGDVNARTSSGFVLRSQEFVADLDGVLLSTQTPVEAQAPFGALNAGKMMLTQTDVENGGHQLVFNNGVKLIYTPQIKRE